MQITKPLIIAEIGVNHNGDMKLAEAMITRAKAVGADAVKFQMFDKEDYPQDNVALQKCWLSREQLGELKQHADKEGIDWFCTPEKPDHVKFLQGLGVKYMKVNHKMCNDKTLLDAVKKTKLPIFISVTPDDFAGTFSETVDPEIYFSKDTILLYCLDKYPPKLEEVRIFEARWEDNDTAPWRGYSNHYPDPFVPIAAMLLGFKVVEVHVKLDNWHQCIDEKVSIDMAGMREIVGARDKMIAMGMLE